MTMQWTGRPVTRPADADDEAAVALARRCAEAMWARDRASQALGMRIEDVGPGFARMTMTVREDMVNGHDICHGGMIFTLADTAFAFACNARDVATVAAGCGIEFLAPAKLGDRLTATAVEQIQSGRTGIYDVRVEDGQGATIAVFRGKSAQLRGSVTGDPVTRA